MQGTGLGALAFVVVGLIIRRAYRYGLAPGGATSRRGVAGFAAGLMAVAVVVGSIAAQSVFRERPDGALPQPETFVLAASILAVGVGAGLRAGATRARSVHTAGVRGSAFVHSIKPAGVGTKGLPVYELDLDVTAPGVVPFRADHREAIPAVMAETIQEGQHVPVMVDAETRRVALDWVRSRGDVAADGFTKRSASRFRRASASAEPLQPPPPIGASTTIAPRVVPVVVTIVLLGLGTTLLNRIFESDEVPVTAAPTDHASTDFGAAPIPTGRIAVDFRAGSRSVSYSLAVPEGWEEDSAPGTDVLLRSSDGESTLVVARPARFNRRPLPPGSDVETALPSVYRDLGDSLRHPRPVTLDGSTGVQFDVRDPKQGSALVVVVHEGYVFFVTLHHPRGGNAGPVLQQVLESWSWG